MNNQREIVLEIISNLTGYSEAPCKKKLQKMIYLMEEKGADLGFDYKIYIYGPYSADLDYTICELKAEKSLDISYSNKEHILKCEKKSKENDLSADIIETIHTFGKKTPLELELIATALYAERHILDKDEHTIIAAVKKIKGNKFSEEKIIDAIQLLKREKYIYA